MSKVGGCSRLHAWQQRPCLLQAEHCYSSERTFVGAAWHHHGATLHAAWLQWQQIWGATCRLCCMQLQLLRHSALSATLRVLHAACCRPHGG